MGAAGFPGVKGNPVVQLMGNWACLECGVVASERPPFLLVRNVIAVHSPFQRSSGAAGREGAIFAKALQELHLPTRLTRRRYRYSY